MQRTDNSVFIKSSISKILEDTVRVCGVLKGRMGTYPLKDYIFQTTFLKMTGASEQKLKCICWELATFDYDYRYELLSSKLGECSSYKDKNKVFKDIFKCIKKLDSNYDIKKPFDDGTTKDNIIQDAHKKVAKLNDSVFINWEFHNYLEYLSYPADIKHSDLCIYKDNEKTYDLLANDLQKFYNDKLYTHRNSCAHNLKSYQTITPSLTSLAKNDIDEINYFKMFFVLILLDEIFIKAFDEYVKLRETAIF